MAQQQKTARKSTNVTSANSSKRLSTEKATQNATPSDVSAHGGQNTKIKPSADVQAQSTAAAAGAATMIADGSLRERSIKTMKQTAREPQPRRSTLMKSTISMLNQAKTAFGFKHQPSKASAATKKSPPPALGILKTMMKSQMKPESAAKVVVMQNYEKIDVGTVNRSNYIEANHLKPRYIYSPDLNLAQKGQKQRRLRRRRGRRRRRRHHYENNDEDEERSDDDESVWLSPETWLVVVICSTLIAIVIIFASLGAGLYLVVEGQQEQRRLTPFVQQVERLWAGRAVNGSYFRENSCLHYAVGHQMSPVCVWASGPGERCDIDACRLQGYTLRGETGRLHPEVLTTNKYRIVPDNTYCMRAIGEKVHLSVCAAGRCNHQYVGKHILARNQRGEWVDNCDEPNPCWDAEAQQTFIWSKYRHRDQCERARPTDCPRNNVTAAVVWMQHKRCALNSVNSGVMCTGLPLALWVCVECFERDTALQLAKEYKEHMCDDIPMSRVISFDNPCFVQCDNSTESERFMPEGSACISPEFPNDKAYCFAGFCFRVSHNSSDIKLIQSLEDCRKEKLRYEAASSLTEG